MYGLNEKDIALMDALRRSAHASHREAIRRPHSLYAAGAVEPNKNNHVSTAPTSSVASTLEQRGARYGSFAANAEATQSLKMIMEAQRGWNRLSDTQRESLHMIQHKISRILNGNPNYEDSWQDIVGYATLAIQELGQHAKHPTYTKSAYTKENDETVEDQ